MYTYTVYIDMHIKVYIYIYIYHNISDGILLDYMYMFMGCQRIFAYTLRYLQQLSIDRLGLVLPRLPVDLLWTLGKVSKGAEYV